MRPARVGRRALLALALAGCASAPAPPAPEPAEPELPPEVALPAQPAAVPEHVLLVSITGLTPEAYGADGFMPLLGRMARAGAAADGVLPVAPAVSAVAHATFLTGRTAAGHGVGGDHPLGAQGAEPQRQRDAGALRAPALWDVVRAAGQLSAALGWPQSVGAPVDWLFPDLQPARLGETWPALLEGQATEALLAAARERGVARPEVGFPGPARDRLLVELACEVLSGEAAPRLVLLGLSQTRPRLAGLGPDAAEVREAFARVDAELGRLAACLARRGRLARTAWFVVGDAPFRPVHTRIQANVALEDAGLLVPSSSSGPGIQRWDAVVRANGGSAFVYARDDEAAILARRALEEAAGGSRAFRVVGAQEMISLGADRQAWFGLEAEPGYAFGEGLSGRLLLRPSRARGAAGALRADDDFPHRTGFVAWGAGVRSGLRIPRMDQLDVAPTVAQALGVRLPEAEARVLVGVFQSPPVAGQRP